MKSFYTMGLVLGVCCAGMAQAQHGGYGSHSLLPMPQVVRDYPVAPVAAYSPYSPRATGTYGTTTNRYADPAAAPEEVSSPSDNAPANPYLDALSQPWNGGHWYGGVYGLYMTRDRDNFAQLSFDVVDPVGQLLSTNSGSMGWEGGFEVRLGRNLCCDRALEVVYWGVFSDLKEAWAVDPDGIPGGPPGSANGVNTALDFSTLNLDNGGGATSVDGWYDSALAHRLRRDYEFHNVEINLLKLAGYCGGCGTCDSCCHRVTCGWVAGVRFFKFDENFDYATDITDGDFGQDPDDELFYNIDVENNLVGFQLGCNMNYDWSSCLNFYANTRFGIYGNHIRHRSVIANESGDVAFVGAGPNADREFDLTSTKDVVSFLGQADLGLRYKAGCHWSADVGYRVVAVSRVALTTEQIPAIFADIDGVLDINSNGNLILHGAYAGVQYAW
jgi:hypothetical protein